MKIRIAITTASMLSLSLLTACFCPAQAAHQDGTVYGVKQWVQSLTQVCDAHAEVIAVNDSGLHGNGFHLGSDTYNVSLIRAAAIMQWPNNDAVADSLTFLFKRYKEGLNRETTCPLIRVKIADAKGNGQPRYETVMPESYGIVDVENGWSKAVYNFPPNTKLYEFAIVSWVDTRPPLPFNSYGNCDVINVEVAAHTDSEKFVAKPSVDTNIRRLCVFSESPDIITFDIPPRQKTRP